MVIFFRFPTAHTGGQGRAGRAAEHRRCVRCIVTSFRWACVFQSVKCSEWTGDNEISEVRGVVLFAIVLEIPLKCNHDRFYCRHAFMYLMVTRCVRDSFTLTQAPVHLCSPTMTFFIIEKYFLRNNKFDNW